MWIMDQHSRAAKRIRAMEMRCYRNILRISYKDHVTNKEVCAKIQQAIEPHERPDHGKGMQAEVVSSSSDLAKTILQSTVKEGRRQGRQKKCGKTISGNGQAWSSLSPRGQWKTKVNGENWLWNYLWCLNDPRGLGIGEGRWRNLPSSISRNA